MRRPTTISSLNEAQARYVIIDPALRDAVVETKRCSRNPPCDADEQLNHFSAVLEANDKLGVNQYDAVASHAGTAATASKAATFRQTGHTARALARKSARSIAPSRPPLPNRPSPSVRSKPVISAQAWTLGCGQYLRR